MFRARKLTILEQSMIDAGIDTSTGIGRYFSQKLQEAGYSQDKVEVELHSSKAKIAYMARLKIRDIENYVAECSWRFISHSRVSRKNRWNIYVNKKDGRGCYLTESDIFSQYDLAGKRIPDV